MTEPTRTMPKCRATTVAGQPCKAPTVMASGFCFSHDDGVAEVRTAARRKGGQHRRWKIEKALEHNPDLGRVLANLAEASEKVKTGEMAPAVGNSLASLGRALIAGITAASDTSKVKELELLLDQVSSEKPPPTRLRAAAS